MTLEDATNEVAGNLKLSKAVAFDPATLLLILEIVAGVIQLIYACNATHAQAAAFANRPGMWGRYRLSRYLRGELKKHPVLHGQITAIQDCFEKMGKSATAEDLANIYNQVNGDKNEKPE